MDANREKKSVATDVAPIRYEPLVKLAMKVRRITEADVEDAIEYYEWKADLGLVHTLCIGQERNGKALKVEYKAQDGFKVVTLASWKVVDERDW